MGGWEKRWLSATIIEAKKRLSNFFAQALYGLYGARINYQGHPGFGFDILNFFERRFY
jgi:hypothetical protein